MSLMSLMSLISLMSLKAYALISFHIPSRQA